MVKVSINGYEAPLTLWHIVELEDGVCNASPKIEQNDQGLTSNHDGNEKFNPSIERPDDWDSNISVD